MGSRTEERPGFKGWVTFVELGDICGAEGKVNKEVLPVPPGMCERRWCDFVLVKRREEARHGFCLLIPTLSISDYFHLWTWWSLDCRLCYKVDEHLQLPGTSLDSEDCP